MSAAVVSALTLVMAPGVAHARLADAPQTTSPQFNGTVNTVDKQGSTLYIGGRFTKVTDSSGVVYTRRGAAAVNAETGKVLRWNPKVRGEVRDLEARREGVYLAGDFTKVRSSARRNLAKVDRVKGVVNRRFKVRTNAAVETLAFSKKSMYFGGEFTKVGKKARNHAAAVTRARTPKLTRWAPRAKNGGVKELVRRGANLYVAGEFRELNGSTAHRRLALVNGKRGATVKGFHPSVDYIVYDIDVTASRVYGAMGGPRGGAVFSLTRTTGAERWERRFDGDAQAVESLGGDVYVGGHFTEVCPDADQEQNGTCRSDRAQSRQRGASFAPATGGLTSWNPDGNGNLGILELTPVGRGRLVAVGDFTTPRGRFAVFGSRS